MEEPTLQAESMSISIMVAREIQCSSHGVGRLGRLEQWIGLHKVDVTVCKAKGNKAREEVSDAWSGRVAGSSRDAWSDGVLAGSSRGAWSGGVAGSSSDAGSSGVARSSRGAGSGGVSMWTSGGERDARDCGGIRRRGICCRICGSMVIGSRRGIGSVWCCPFHPGDCELSSGGTVIGDRCNFLLDGQMQGLVVGGQGIMVQGHCCHSQSRDCRIASWNVGVCSAYHAEPGGKLL
jgi:hypothetical protein